MIERGEEKLKAVNVAISHVLPIFIYSDSLLNIRAEYDVNPEKAFLGVAIQHLKTLF